MTTLPSHCESLPRIPILSRTPNLKTRVVATTPGLAGHRRHVGRARLGRRRGAGSRGMGRHPRQRQRNGSLQHGVAAPGCGAHGARPLRLSTQQGRVDHGHRRVAVGGCWLLLKWNARLELYGPSLLNSLLTDFVRFVVLIHEPLSFSLSFPLSRARGSCPVATPDKAYCVVASYLDDNTVHGVLV